MAEPRGAEDRTTVWGLVAAGMLTGFAAGCSSTRGAARPAEVRRGATGVKGSGQPVRFVSALIAFVLAAVLIALGVAQRTVLLPADHITRSTTISQNVRFAVISGETLSTNPGQQRLRVSGGSVVFAAYGRTPDVLAWLAGEQYARLGLSSTTGAFTTPKIETAPVLTGIGTGGSTDPNGSDLWLDQRRSSGSVDWTIDVPAGVSVLIASDGTAAVPGNLSVSWPVSVQTPFATPLIVIGSALLVLGLVLYIWALVHMKRRRGPRRKPPPKMPKPPAPHKMKPTAATPASSSRGRRAVRRVALPASGVLIATVMLAGCAQPATPAVSASATKTAAVQTAAVLTEAQADRIVRAAAAVAAKADAAASSSALQSRFAGSALTLRDAIYRIRKKDKSSVDAPQAIPVNQIAVVLPEATTTWPRTLFAVTKPSANAKTAPVALTLEQQTPRSNYQVLFQTALQPDAAQPVLPSPIAGLRGSRSTRSCSRCDRPIWPLSTAACCAPAPRRWTRGSRPRTTPCSPRSRHTRRRRSRRSVPPRSSRSLTSRPILPR